MPNLSKSKIFACRQCPKRLWLELNRPELRDDSDSEMAFAIGNEVGVAAIDHSVALAKFNFPPVR